MKRYILFILTCLLFVCCDSRIEHEGKNYAVVTGQKVSMVVMEREGSVMEYHYVYNTDETLKSITSFLNGNKMSSYEYSYEASGYEVANNYYRYRFDDMSRPSECLISTSFSSDEELVKTKYTYNGSALSAFEAPDVTCHYEWNEDGDISGVNIDFQYGGPLKISYTYSDVINNFGVPMPGLCLFCYGYMFSDICYGQMPSKHLPSCSYERNGKGDISNILFDELGFQLEFHYTD